MDWEWLKALATPGLLIVLIGLGFKMFGKIDAVRQELDGKIDGVRQEVNANIDGVRQEQRQDINRLDANMARLDANINRVAEGLARIQGPLQGG